MSAVNMSVMPRSNSNYCFLFLGGHSFDVIIFDVDNKDTTLGMNCPPAAFVEALILQKVSNLLTPRGTVFLTFILTIHFPSLV